MFSVALFQASTHPRVELNSCQSDIGQVKRGWCASLNEEQFPVLKTAEAAASIFQLALFTSSAVNFCF